MKRRFKLRYRIIILAVIFLGALIYFSRNFLVVQSFDLTSETTQMAPATLPNISLLVDGEELNRLYGYTSNLDWNLNRETITPINADRAFTVCIEENEMTVRRLKYELFDVTEGTLLDSGTISALSADKESDYSGVIKTARIKLNAEMKEGTEYSVKITLVTSNSKRVYYYTRVKLYSNASLAERIAYVRWFRESALTKTNQVAIEKNLETRNNSDTTSFAYTDIYSSWENVSWGELEPKIVAELPPTITDFYEGTSTIVLSYVVSMDVGSGEELYLVREAFRFLYTDIRTYLYNYEREVEAIYDVKNTSLSKDDLKLGITAHTDMELLFTDKCAYTAFVRNRELWCYDRKENSMIRVFSFRSEEVVDLMELYDAHDIKLLKLDSDGNMDFLVYGYMNRGEYEGRVGMILYRYDRKENRIEERAYIPINTTYQMLKGEVDEFIYMNKFDILYLTIFDTIYSYNLTTRSLHRIVEDVPSEQIVFLKNLQHVIWQGAIDPKESGALTVMNLESGEQRLIHAAEDEVICLLGKIDENLVYGYAKISDIAIDYDGSRTIPMYRVVIADIYGSVQKEYQQEGFYVTDARIENNVIYLTRVKKEDSVKTSYIPASSDAIQNRTVATTSLVSITGRVTKLAKTEYYISFPGDIDMKETPKQIEVPITVLTSDRTVRITAPDYRSEQYMTYSFGRIVTQSRDVVAAIRLANSDENVGVVIDNRGKLIWERGVNAVRISLHPTLLHAVEGQSELQAALKMIFTYEGFEVDTTTISFIEKSVTEWMEQYLNVSALNLSGARLSEVLYYVSKKCPVIGNAGEEGILLITGYDKNSLEVVEPLSGKERKLDIGQAEELFEDNGNRFIGYMK